MTAVHIEGIDATVTIPSPTDRPATTDKDISSQRFWAQSFDEREKTFAWLREHAPVSWHRPLEVEYPVEVHHERGFWAIVKAKDITYVSRNHELFSSDQQINNIMLRPRFPAAISRPSCLEMDPPLHTDYRKVMSTAFTPKGVRRITDKINERAAQIIDRVVGAGDIDFVEEVSAKLPMLTVADMVGVPESQVHAFAQAADGFVGAHDPDVNGGMDPTEFALQQVGIVMQIGLEAMAYRKDHPSDDIATALANADHVFGRPLNQAEVGAVMLLLAVAGNDTTKQTTTRTVMSLWEHPEQRAWLMEDFDGRIMPSIDEFVRHASPVIEFARTATRDVELGGQLIPQGDKVVIFYCSGNRDDEVFTDPARFDLQRPASNHVGFGGGGVHFCLGNGVAKAQLRAMFQQILTKLPGMQITGEPVPLLSEFIRGVKHLPVHIPRPSGKDHRHAQVSDMRVKKGRR
ncbi:cytochrome P450 [Cumulibacter manganitolerans]|uniref:cytochrome P450 n=1 Tax=Cumulibacter manganitolerans TaxID=1884992 RepID=UPI0012961C47|nr:cytochrome P450 [Cumulibacter manganitolerans]